MISTTAMECVNGQMEKRTMAIGKKEPWMVMERLGGLMDATMKVTGMMARYKAGVSFIALPITIHTPANSVIIKNTEMALF